MPIYEYRCPSCGREWETVKSLKERDAETCCQTPSIRRVSLPAQNHWLNYYSRELGRWITSPGQRKRVENELGVVSTSHIKHIDDITKKPDTPVGTQKEFDSVWREVTSGGS